MIDLDKYIQTPLLIDKASNPRPGTCGTRCLKELS
jgi:hypothetical protein